MRLPTGEVEVATASAIEDAFRCGLADARTPVRSVGSAVWRTLGEVAEIDTTDPRDLGSLLPVAVEEPAADLSEGRRWVSRTDIDAREFQPKARNLAGVAAAAMGIAVAVFCGVQVTARMPEASALGSLPFAHHIGAPKTVAPSAEVPAKAPSEMQEVYRPIADSWERADRLARERRLREMDAARRIRERKYGIRGTKSRTPVEPPAASTDPFSASGNPLDPLNSAL